MQGHVYLDKPLCSMEGVAMTTHGPMSSRCWEDLRWVTCLNMKGLEAYTVHHMGQQAASQHCLHCLLCNLNVANLMISSIGRYDDAQTAKDTWWPLSTPHRVTMMNGGLCFSKFEDLKANLADCKWFLQQLADLADQQASMAHCNWFLHQLANLAKQGTA